MGNAIIRASRHRLNKLFGLGLLLIISTVQATSVDPKDLVNSAIEDLRTQVSRDRDLIENDPTHAMQIVRSAIAPHMDMQLTSRLVLGKHWQQASATQRDRFADGLQRLLLRLFALHLNDYHDAEVNFLPTLYKGENVRALVRTEVSREGSPAVSVNYRFHRTATGWKVYDVALFGISLVKTYHVSIARDVQTHGLDGVIEQINAKVPLRAERPSGT